MKLPILKQSSKDESYSLTMAVVSFNLVCIWLILSLIGPSLHWNIPTFSGTDAMAFLSPVLALYFGRKHQDNQSTSQDTDQP